MAFEGLSSKLQETIKKLKGKGKLSEKDIKEAMREVKLALLEADVNIRMINQGSSEINIIVGVENDDFEKAVRGIYKAFIN